MILNLALLFLSAACTMAESYNCTKPLPSNCDNLPSIKFIKGDGIYQMILFAREQLFPVSLRTTESNLTWINCSQVCDACNSLTGISGNTA